MIALFCRLNLNRKRDLPIRSSEMGLLIFATRSELPPSPIDAARFFRVSKPMVTAMVKSLETKGYLTRRYSQTDARSFVLEPTTKARQLVEEAHTEYLRHMEILYGGLGKDAYDRLIALLSEANRILVEVD